MFDEDYGDVNDYKIKDGGNVYIKCSDCNKNLVDICITRPDVPEKWTIVAECCFCKGKSFPVEIKGIFYIGGISKKFNKITTDDEGVTAINEVIHEKDNYVKIQTVKA